MCRTLIPRSAHVCSACHREVGRATRVSPFGLLLILGGAFGAGYVYYRSHVRQTDSEALVGIESKAVEATPTPSVIATPVPTPPPRYALTLAVQVRTQYGAITVPANTEVAIVRHIGDSVVVRASGQEFQVLSNQIHRVPSE
jgi:hypothetical protein